MSSSRLWKACTCSPEKISKGGEPGLCCTFPRVKKYCQSPPTRIATIRSLSSTSQKNSANRGVMPDFKHARTENTPTRLHPTDAGLPSKTAAPGAASRRQHPRKGCGTIAWLHVADGRSPGLKNSHTAWFRHHPNVVPGPAWPGPDGHKKTQPVAAVF